jgi:hypothetical protein
MGTTTAAAPAPLAERIARAVEVLGRSWDGDDGPNASDVTRILTPRMIAHVCELLEQIEQVDGESLSGNGSGDMEPGCAVTLWRFAKLEAAHAALGDDIEQLRERLATGKEIQ